MGFEKEGTITFWLRHEHKDWTTDDHSYNFGEVEAFGIKAQAIKHPDKTLQIDLNGAHGKHYSIREQMPTPDDKGEVFVAVTWDISKAIFYLNGQPVQNIPA